MRIVPVASPDVYNAYAIDPATDKSVYLGTFSLTDYPHSLQGVKDEVAEEKNRNHEF